MIWKNPNLPDDYPIIHMGVVKISETPELRGVTLRHWKHVNQTLLNIEWYFIINFN